MRLNPTALLCATLLLTPSIASAAGEEAAGTAVFGGAISTTTLAIGAPLTTTGGIISSITGLFSSATGQLDHYIRENAVALQQDLQVGGGQTVNDLAQIFNVPAAQRPAFARMLRAHSAQLIPLTQIPHEDHARTRRFIIVIAAAMSQDPAMAPSVAHLLEEAKRAEL